MRVRRCDGATVRRRWLAALVMVSMTSVLSTACSGSGGTGAEAGTTAAVLDERGRQIWAETCSRCHDGGLGEAPPLGDVDAWRPRLAKGQDVLLRHAVEGFTGEIGDMPPRGGNTALSDEDVRLALAHMTRLSQ